MRTLKFIVNKQIIIRDPSCDFSGLVPGTEGYLRAEFCFSKDWDGCVKVASFLSSTGHEFEPRVLEDGLSCDIPSEALTKRAFKIQVLGKGENLKLVTNKVTVLQDC